MCYKQYRQGETGREAILRQPSQHPKPAEMKFSADFWVLQFIFTTQLIVKENGSHGQAAGKGY